MESLTDQIEAEILRLMQLVEDAGGAVAAIERGLQKSEIERSAYDVARSVDSGERVVVGVNRFTVEEASRSDMLRVDPAIEAQQVERLERLRASRDAGEVERGLAGVRAAAEGSENTLPAIRVALAAFATVGEVSDALRDVWGTYVPVDVF
jgi:methylmalonyl-CoA mutase N-terminal domain/subunit